MRSGKIKRVIHECNDRIVDEWEEAQKYNYTNQSHIKPYDNMIDYLKYRGISEDDIFYVCLDKSPPQTGGDSMNNKDNTSLYINSLNYMPPINILNSEHNYIPFEPINILEKY
jgi:hypothetical protein